MKPMLAGKCTDVTKLRYPVLVSPKLDGVRALVVDGVVLSRSLKPIPNRHVQALFGRQVLNGFDGELLVGPPTALDAYRRTMSGVMSGLGTPDVWFRVFDWPDDEGTDFAARLDMVEKQLHCLHREGTFERVVRVPHLTVTNAEELLAYERGMLAEGYEGVMVRDPAGPYKEGRSTEAEGWLLKLKRFEDGEAIVRGFVELQHNGNAATVDNLGHTKRSSHRAGKTGKSMLGALIVEDRVTGVRFEIGTGFTEAQRRELWETGVASGALVKYKYFPGGVKDKPRFPVFLGFRDARDT